MKEIKLGKDFSVYLSTHERFVAKKAFAEGKKFKLVGLFFDKKGQNVAVPSVITGETKRDILSIYDINLNSNDVSYELNSDNSKRIYKIREIQAALGTSRSKADYIRRYVLPKPYVDEFGGEYWTYNQVMRLSGIAKMDKYELMKKIADF